MKKTKPKIKKKPINLLTPIVFVYLFMALGLTVFLNSGLSNQRMTTQSRADEPGNNDMGKNCSDYLEEHSCNNQSGGRCYIVDGSCVTKEDYEGKPCKNIGCMYPFSCDEETNKCFDISKKDYGPPANPPPQDSPQSAPACPDDPPSAGCFPQEAFDQYNSKYSCSVMSNTSCDGVCAQCDFGDSPSSGNNGSDKGIGTYCTARNQEGSCRRSCSGVKVPSSQGASGCGEFADDIQCCIAGGGTQPQNDQPSGGQGGRCQQDNIGLQCSGGYVSGQCPGDSHFRKCVSGWNPNEEVGNQNSGGSQSVPKPPVQTTKPSKPGANDPKGVIDQNDGKKIRGWAFDPDDTEKSIEIHIYIYPAGGAAEGYNTGPTTVDRSGPGDVNEVYGITGVHGFEWKVPAKWCNGTEYTADVFASNVGKGGNTTLGGYTWTCGGGQGSQPQQPSQQSSSCKALPPVPDLAFNDVLPGKTSAIDWPAVEGAVRYQIRLDDPANPWNGSCTNPEPGDICDDNVTAESPKTTYTFSPGFKFREKQYRFWYHAVNSCGAVSESGEGFITVKQGATPSSTPEPQNSPVPKTSTTPSPSKAATTPTPQITPNDPIKFIPVPNDIPPLCPDGSKEPDLILPKTIDAGTYMIQFAQAPPPGSTYGLIIDDLSNGALTDCKKTTGEDLCADITKSEYGPVTFAKGKTYRVSYFEKKACGRTSNIAQYEVKVQ